MNPPLMDRLRQAVADDRLRPLDLALADWCLRHGSGEPVAAAMALVSRAAGDGHTCLPLDTPPALPGDSPLWSGDGLPAMLRESPLVGGPDDENRPLIYDRNALYLQRYHDYERRLAARLRELMAVEPAPVDFAPLIPGGPLFDAVWTGPGEPQWQAVAAFVALRRRLAVISGGPGTGKTYTVVRLMRLLMETAVAAGHPPPVIQLAAPTGKAAARMMESVRRGLAEMGESGGLPDRIAALLPREATTLHRLLGLTRHSIQPHHHRDRPLATDTVIVDEASMVDLPLMTKLAEAVPDHGRLILLGDRYQLASVESGSVLAELCRPAGVNAFSRPQREAAGALLAGYAPPPGAAPENRLLADHVVTLRTSHRFRPDSPIGRLAAAVNAGDMERLVEIADHGHTDVTVRLWDDAAAGGFEAALHTLPGELADAYHPLFEADRPEETLAALERTRLLTATRIGPTGSETLNRRITEHLARRHGLDPNHRWYHGRPVLITHNDYRAGLFNGDTGVCLRGADGRLRVWFASRDGLRALLPTALPEHETAYAMTVHKSQGSEFEAVTLLLPAHETPLLTRELIYTGLTRARERITILGARGPLEAALRKTTRRASKLAERLSGH